jgi:hypothetical protein
MSNMTTRELLAEYAALLNEHGVDSLQASRFLEAHSADMEFYELARLSNKLKRALTAPTCGRMASRN